MVRKAQILTKVTFPKIGSVDKSKMADWRPFWMSKIGGVITLVPPIFFVATVGCDFRLEMDSRDPELHADVFGFKKYWFLTKIWPFFVETLLFFGTFGLIPLRRLKIIVPNFEAACTHQWTGADHLNYRKYSQGGPPNFSFLWNFDMLYSSRNWLSSCISVLVFQTGIKRIAVFSLLNEHATGDSSFQLVISVWHIIRRIFISAMEWWIVLRFCVEPVTYYLKFL